MKKINKRLDLVLDVRAQIAEGPFWDQEKQLFYWVDILEKTINIYNPETSKNRIIQLKKMIGALIPAENGKLLAALEDGIQNLEKKLTKLNSRFLMLLPVPLEVKI